LALVLVAPGLSATEDDRGTLAESAFPVAAAKAAPRLRQKLASGGLRVLKSVLFIVIGVYVGLSLYMFVFQERVVFYPSKRVTATPDQIGLSYEELVLPTKGGQTVSAWFVPSENSRGTVVFCHGNAGNIGDRLDTLEIFNGLGQFDTI